jgi:uncharacterized RDD family membrane protein YckC
VSADRDRFHAPHLQRQRRLEGTELASFRSRAWAFLIDGAIVFAMLLGLKLWRTQSIEANASDFSVTVDFATALGIIVTLLYFGLGTYIGRGTTIGKRLLGIRVVSLVHAELSLWHSIERALGYAASTLEAGFGFLQYFKHPNRQTVHDRIAETIVIVEPRKKAGDGAPEAWAAVSRRSGRW